MIAHAGAGERARRGVRRRGRDRRAADRRLVVPRHRADLRRRRRPAASRARLDLQRLGQQVRAVGRRRRCVAGRWAEHAGRRDALDPDGARGRLDRRRRRRHAGHHDAVPDAPEPQPGADAASRSRRALCDELGVDDGRVAAVRPGPRRRHRRPRRQRRRVRPPRRCWSCRAATTTAEDDWLRMQRQRALRPRRARRRAAQPLEVVEVPVLPFVEVGGRRVAVPYLNYYVGNGVRRRAGVRTTPPTPTCWRSSPSSTPAATSIGLDVGAVLAYGGGGIHCITQQVPAWLTGQPLTPAPGSGRRWSRFPATVTPRSRGGRRW